jgi:hypothetical protein
MSAWSREGRSLEQLRGAWDCESLIGTVAEDDDAENKAIVAAEREHRKLVP